MNNCEMESQALDTGGIQATVAAAAGQANTADNTGAAVVTDNGPPVVVTLKQLAKLFFTDYRAHRWKPYSINTDKSTEKDLPRLIRFFGADRVISTIAEADAEDFMDETSFGLTDRKTPMTEAGALSIYYSARRMFDYAVDGKLLPKNVFRTMDPDAIPEIDREIRPGERVNEAEAKQLARALLDSVPVYGSVKSVLFILLAYGTHLRPGKLMNLTWPELDELEAAGALSPWASRLITSYRPAQEQWLADNRLSNPEEYVFVNGKPEGDTARPAAAGTAGTWLRKKILEPLHLPLVTINVLSSETEGVTPQNAFDGLDPAAEYPIYGPVTFPEPVFGRKKTPEERARKLAARAARREKYDAKKNNK